MGHFPSARSGRSDQPVLKWNTRVLRTGSGQNGPALSLPPQRLREKERERESERKLGARGITFPEIPARSPFSFLILQIYSSLSLTLHPPFKNPKEPLRMREGPAQGSEPLSFPTLVGQSAGIWRAGRENVRARLGPLH